MVPLIGSPPATAPAACGILAAGTASSGTGNVPVSAQARDRGSRRAVAPTTSATARTGPLDPEDRMHLAFLPAPGGYPLWDGGAAAALGRRLEDAGAESLWVVEHVVVPESYDSTYPYAPDGRMGLPVDVDIPDPLELLAFVAGATDELRLGTAMLILPEHHPVHLAKRLATLDRLSGGRLLAGVGIGWLEEEYDAVGVPFARRGARADEYLEAMLALWSGAPASYDGEFVSFGPVHSNPRPTRDRVPLVIGGHSPAAARRAGRYGDAMYPLGVSLEQLRELRAEIDAAARGAGRDPGEVTLTAVAPRTREEIEQLRELGVDRVLMSSARTDLDGIAAKVEGYRRDVLDAA